MKYKKIAEQYDGIFTKDKKAFSGEPLPLVRKLGELMSAGCVLELGAGAGRNSLYLAGRGLEVTATDLSSASIALIKERAAAEGVLLDARVQDATSAISGQYDAIVCTFTLHHLDRSDALAVIKAMQSHTKPGGYNVFTTFTKEGAFYRANPETSHFYLDTKDELAGFYAGWIIHSCFEKEGEAREPDAKGDKQSNVFAGLLAQKPL